jgi:hypothetical protein
VINLCEMKYSESEFSIDKSYAEDLVNKREIFTNQTKTKKSVYLTFVTTFGIKNNGLKDHLLRNTSVIGKFATN